MNVLVFGGSGSGKSAYAEDRAAELHSPGGQLIYIASMEPFGQEAEKRIERHQKMRRAKGFQTIERYRDIDSLSIPKGSTVLLECIGNLCANEMFSPDGSGGNPGEKIIAGLNALRLQTKNLILVSNDVFSDGCIYDGETLDYIKALAEINRAVGGFCQEVIEVVCGIAVARKNRL